MHIAPAMHMPTLRRPIGAFVSLVLALISLCAILVPYAEAHQSEPRFAGDKQVAYYRGAYPTADFPLQWWFESRWPNGDGQYHRTKAAILRADDPWNALRSGGFFKDSGYREIHYPAPYSSVRVAGESRTNFCRDTRDDPTVPGENPRPLNLIYWEPSPRDEVGIRKLGEATHCFYQDGRPRSFALVLNSADTWNTRRDWRNMRTDVFDLQSVATHELGHATGFLRHFNEPLEENAPDEWSGTRARCGATSSKRETMCPGGDTGKAYERTLGPHDIHTFKGAYP